MKRMNRYQISTLFLIVLAMVLLVACQPGETASARGADSEKAADLLGYRWQAMADFYARNELLQSSGQKDNEVLRRLGQINLYAQGDDFDYAAAADLHTARWQAMADFYARNELLQSPGQKDNEVLHRFGQANLYAQGDDFDTTAAADLHAARWQAMADYYAQNGMLNNGGQLMVVGH